MENQPPKQLVAYDVALEICIGDIQKTTIRRVHAHDQKSAEILAVKREVKGMVDITAIEASLAESDCFIDPENKDISYSPVEAFELQEVEVQVVLSGVMTTKTIYLPVEELNEKADDIYYVS